MNLIISWLYSGVIPKVSGWGEYFKHPQGTGPFLGAHWRRPDRNVQPVPPIPVLLPGLWGHPQHLWLQRSRGRSFEGQTWALWQQGEAYWWGGFRWRSSRASEQTLSLQGTCMFNWCKVWEIWFFWSFYRVNIVN